jgi:membrane protein implicated in regulation of membrane protease activity
MILEAWHWIAAGVILVVAEVVVPGAALVWLGRRGPPCRLCRACLARI